MSSSVERNPLVHGANLVQKEAHRSKYRDEDSRRYLLEIRDKHNQWYQANLLLNGPNTQIQVNDKQIINQRVELLTEYKDFLD